MQLCVAVLMVSVVGFGGPQDVRIPKEAPEKMPSGLVPDFERGQKGDVFSMIRANQWPGRRNEVEVFPNALIQQKLEELAKTGDPKAMVKLADYIQVGDVGTKERNEALGRIRKLIEKAAWLEEPSAMHKYSNDLWEYDKNKGEAIKWWLKGREIYKARAIKGDQEAIIALAFYGKIQPVVNNDKVLMKQLDDERIEWWRKASEFNTDAAYEFGTFMEIKDHKESIKWIEKAASEGHWHAMIQMARWYAQGFPDGVERKFDPAIHPELVKKKDLVKAWEWLDKAAELVGWEMASDQIPELGTESFPKRPQK